MDLWKNMLLELLVSVEPIENSLIAQSTAKTTIHSHQVILDRNKRK